MADIIDKKEVSELADIKDDYCISIYLPTHRAGIEVKNDLDSKQLKNLLKEARDDLIEAGLKAHEAEEHLKPASDLLEDTDFWSHQSEGLAIFIGKDHFKYYRLPIDFEPFKFVSVNYYLRPLLPLFTGSGRFFILQIGREHLNLYEASKTNIREIKIDDLVPATLDESYFYQEFRKDYLQQHSGSGERMQAQFHGHGSGDLKMQKKELTKFFNEVDEGLRKRVFAWLSDPLILAGVEYLHPIYRSANSYPHLLANGVTVNFDHDQIKDIHKKAWEVVEPYFTSKKDEKVNNFDELSGTGKTDNTFEEVVINAVNGRVDTLFVKNDSHVWGQYDEENDKVIQKEEPEYGDRCLLDYAAVKTSLQKGTVYLVDENEIPLNGGKYHIGALYRY